MLNNREQKLHENLFWPSMACWLGSVVTLAEPHELEEYLQNIFDGFLESEAANDLQSRTQGMVLKEHLSELFHMLNLFHSLGVARQIKGVTVTPTEYRNTIEVTSEEGIEVDQGSLWKVKDNYLILVDEDQHATHKLTTDFVEADKK